jgi:hypothetical protein
VKIADRFPEQFQGGPYFLGISIDAGWESIVSNACQAIQTALTEDELKLFHWIQIKEKFGGLNMYWGPHNTLPVTIIGHAQITNLEVESKHTEPGFSPDTVATIRAIVERAGKKASKTCEVCGAEGRLYAGSYWRTLCDTHANEDGRTFPPAYGQFIECRPAKQTFSDREAISTRAVFFRGAGGRVWDWIEDGADHSFILAADLPAGLVDTYLQTKNDAHEIFRVPYSDPDDENFTSFAINDFLKTLKKPAGNGAAVKITQAYFKLPKGALRDTRSQLEKDIEMNTGTAVEIVTRVDAQSLGGFAVGKIKAGKAQLFAIQKPNDPVRVKFPAKTLTTEIEILDRLRYRLTEMLEQLEKNNDGT